MLNKGVTPYIPEKGSLGASGDLAPLSHMVLPMLGLGRAYYKGELLSGQEALDRAGIEKIQLAAKEAPSLINGIKAVRHLHYRVISETGMTTADEMLYPENLPLVDDLISYMAVGARSVEDQQHRFVASGADFPTGFKNPTSGNLNVMFNGIYAAQNKQSFLFLGKEVETTGNPLSHAILRGALNEYGKNIPNYYYDNLMGLGASLAFGW